MRLGGSLVGAVIALAVAGGAASPTWLQPETLFGGWDPYYVRPGLAVNQEGDAAVVSWGDPQDEGIWASIRPAGGPWGPPEAIARPVLRSDPVAYPSVQWDPSGGLTAVWWDNGLVYESDHPGGGSWSVRRPLSATAGESSSARLAIDGEGNAVVIWRRALNGQYFIEARFRPAGGDWQETAILASTTSD